MGDNDIFSYRQEVAGFLEGTCNSEDAAIERFGLDCESEDITDWMLALGIERCKGCDYWHESCDLVPDETEGDEELVGYCPDCRAEGASRR